MDELSFNSILYDQVSKRLSDAFFRNKIQINDAIYMNVVVEDIVTELLEELDSQIETALSTAEVDFEEGSIVLQRDEPVVKEPIETQEGSCLLDMEVEFSK